MAEIIVPRRAQDWFDKDGNFTLQAFRFFEQLTELTNESATIIEVSATPEALDSSLQQVIKILNGLAEFTVDTTGFTIDTTHITTDKVIA